MQLKSISAALALVVAAAWPIASAAAVIEQEFHSPFYGNVQDVAYTFDSALGNLLSVKLAYTLTISLAYDPPQYLPDHDVDVRFGGDMSVIMGHYGADGFPTSSTVLRYLPFGLTDPVTIPFAGRNPPSEFVMKSGEIVFGPAYDSFFVGDRTPIMGPEDWDKLVRPITIYANGVPSFSEPVFLGDFGTKGDYTLTYLYAATPEPGEWVMMIAGFGTVGFAMRRRARDRVAFA